MRLNMIKTITIAFILLCLQTTVYASDSSKATFTVTVESETATQVTYSINISTEELYSSAQVDLSIIGGSTVDKIELSSMDIGSFVSPKDKEGIYYFGFINGNNKQSGELNAFNISVNKGSTVGTITMKDSFIVKITEKGGADKISMDGPISIRVPAIASNSESSGGSDTANTTSNTTTTNLADIDETIVPLAGGGNQITLDGTIEDQWLAVRLEDADLWSSIDSDAFILNSIIINTEDLDISAIKGVRFYMDQPLLAHSKTEEVIALTSTFGTLEMGLDAMSSVTNTEYDWFMFELSRGVNTLNSDYGSTVIASYIDDQIFDWETTGKKIKITVPSKVDGGHQMLLVNSEEAFLTMSKTNEAENGVEGFISAMGTYMAHKEAKDFTDMSNSWAKKEVEFLAARKIINGRGDGLYGVDDNITRADFTVLLMGILSEQLDGLDEVNQSDFTDVMADNYYYKPIKQAGSYGLINGKGNGLFAPNDQISREEMMTITARSLEKLEISLASNGNIDRFSDKDAVSIYAYESVDQLVSSGLIQGSEGLLNPQNSLSRAEAARIIYMVWESVYDNQM